MDDDGLPDIVDRIDDGEMLPAFQWSPDSYSGSDEEFLTYTGDVEYLLKEVRDSLIPKEDDEQQNGVWDSMPDEILWNILMRLPIASQCRYRKVCSKWRALMSTPSARQHGRQLEFRPICTIMFDREVFEGKFFCHAEEKWYQMPFQSKSLLNFRWMLRATDKGLVCYQAYVDGKSWLLVCNPITGSSQVVPPKYPTANRRYTYHPRVVSFAVDPETVSFKIVLVHYLKTMLFQSETQKWKLFKEDPSSARKGNELLWRNMIYKETWSGFLLAFDMQSGMWCKIKEHLPLDCKGDKWMHRILRSQQHVMAVLLESTSEDPVQICSLLNAKDATTSSPSRWEKVAVKAPATMGRLVDEFQYCWSHRSEFLYFATCRTYQWIEYAFRTKTWRVMPPVSNYRSSSPPWLGLEHSRISYKWLGWELRIDIEVKSVAFNAEDYPKLVAVLRERDSSDSDR